MNSSDRIERKILLKADPAQVWQALSAIRLRSDVERKRLFGEQHVPNDLQAGIYSPDAAARYDQSVKVLRAGILHRRVDVISAAWVEIMIVRIDGRDVNSDDRHLRSRRLYRVLRHLEFALLRTTGRYKDSDLLG